MLVRCEQCRFLAAWCGALCTLWRTLHFHRCSIIFRNTRTQKTETNPFRCFSIVVALEDAEKCHVASQS